MERVYEPAHDEIVTILSSFIPSFENRNPTSNLSANPDTYEPSAKLPKLDLPKFSGLHEEWENFCDLFTTLVHNSSRLSDAT